MEESAKKRSVLSGAVAAAFLASLCCVGPLLFVLLGAGTFGAASYFEKARPFLMTGAVLLLAVAFYWMYSKRADCAPGEACESRPAGRANRLGLWAASVAVLVFALLPYIAGPLAARIGGKEAPAQAAAPFAMQTATFKVEGMTCASCETTIKLALERTPGVSRAEVSYDRGEAAVEYDPQKTTPDKLRDAINSTGYTVKGEN